MNSRIIFCISQINLYTFLYSNNKYIYIYKFKYIYICIYKFKYIYLQSLNYNNNAYLHTFRDATNSELHHQHDNDDQPHCGGVLVHGLPRPLLWIKRGELRDRGGKWCVCGCLFTIPVNEERMDGCVCYVPYTRSCTGIILLIILFIKA